MKFILLLISSTFVFAQLSAQHLNIDFLLKNNIDGTAAFYKMSTQLSTYISFKNKQNLNANRTDLWIDNNWVKVDSTEYIYNSNNGTNEEINRKLIDGSWVLVGKIINNPNAVYDPLNGIEEPAVIEQVWNGNVWIDARRYFIEVNENQHVLKSFNQTWNGESWINVSQALNEFDSNDELSLSIFQNWMNNEWEDVDKFTFFYDTYGNNTNTLWQQWRKDVGEWINFSQFTYTYEDTTITRLLTERWDYTSWVNSFNYTYQYDSNNNNILALTEAWDGIIWQNHSKNTYEYDLNNFVTYELLQYWEDDQWINDKRIYYYYDNLPTHLATHQLSEMPFTAYPNPSNGYFQLDFKSDFGNDKNIRIFDINGNLIHNNTITAGNKSNSFELANLAKGTYILNVKLGNTIYSDVLVIK